jgi:superfamily II DNA/RNA helicase
MSLKKYNEVLKTALIDAGFENQTEFQQKSIVKFKEGGDFIGVGPKGCGKTTAIVSGVLQRLEKATEDDAPRAVIIVLNKEKTLEIEAEFLRLSRRMDLRIVIAHDKGHKVQQRIALYVGSDIVIGTAKRLYEMYIHNGLNLAKVKMFIIDDAEAVLKAGFQTPILRLAESIQKSQCALINDAYTDRMRKMADLLMVNHTVLEVKETEDVSAKRGGENEI